MRCYCGAMVEHLSSELEVVGSNPNDVYYIQFGIDFCFGFIFQNITFPKFLICFLNMQFLLYSNMFFHQICTMRCFRGIVAEQLPSELEVVDSNPI